MGGGLGRHWGRGRRHWVRRVIKLDDLGGYFDIFGGEVNRNLGVIHDQGKAILLGIFIDDLDHFLADAVNGFVAITVKIVLRILGGALEEFLFLFRVTVKAGLLVVAQVVTCFVNWS